MRRLGFLRSGTVSLALVLAFFNWGWIRAESAATQPAPIPLELERPFQLTIYCAEPNLNVLYRAPWGVVQVEARADYVIIVRNDVLDAKLAELQELISLAPTLQPIDSGIDLRLYAELRSSNDRLLALGFFGPNPGQGPDGRMLVDDKVVAFDRRFYDIIAPFLPRGLGNNLTHP